MELAEISPRHVRSFGPSDCVHGKTHGWGVPPVSMTIFVKPDKTRQVISDPDIVQLLLDRRARTSGNGEDPTALHYTSIHGHLEVVPLLLDHGAPVRSQI